MRDLKYDIARSFAMIWIVGIYHMSEYVSLPLHTQQWARIVTWSCLGVFTFISAYFLSGKNTFFNFSDIFLFYKKRLLRFYPLFFVAAITMLLIDFNDWDQTWRGLLGVSSYYAPQINTLWYISMLIGFYLITPPLVLCGNYNINYCYIQSSSLEFAFVNLYLEPELIIGFFIILQYMCWGLYLLDTFRFQGK